MTSILKRFKVILGFSTPDCSNKIFLQNRFDIKIKDWALFELALTHRSHTSTADNERLELLGDAVLDLIVADHIYRQFPEMDEGLMTKLKSKYISRENLRIIAKNEGLIDNLDLSKQRDLDDKLIIGNVLEALFGAIYIDQGYAISKDRAIVMFERASPVEDLLSNIHDPKSQLLEWAQKHKRTVRFVIDTRGRDWFEARLFLDQEHVGTGTGKSKKKSEKDAARAAIKLLNILPPVAS